MNDKGEETLLLNQIHQMSKDILVDLLEVDTKLAAMEEDIKLHDEINKKTILENISSIRTIVGAIEREDVEEMKDEEIVQNINKKLRVILEMAIG